MRGCGRTVSDGDVHGLGVCADFWHRLQQGGNGEGFALKDSMG